MAVAIKPLPLVLEQKRPITRWPYILTAVAFGIGILWSFAIVDASIGDRVANSLLGHNAKEAAISSGAAGALFAFVSGLAGTFTACNIAAFSAIAPLMGQQDRSFRSKVAEFFKPVGWLALGMSVVAGVYGAIGAGIGTSIPQLSEGTLGPNKFPVRLLQSSIVFGLIGLALIYMGLAALKAVPDPLAKLYARLPRAQLVIMGGLIGGFLIGRPFALFHKMFQYAAERHNALYGAGMFVLQALGNIVILVALFALLTFATRGKLAAWLQAKPGRLAKVTAFALIAGGVFFVAYWDVRLPSFFHYGWWPTMPWNAG